MATNVVKKPVSRKTLRERVSPAEWQTRVDLAACYRLIAHFRWTDMIYTHISARVPGEPDHFLINAYGLMFDEIKASNLVKVDHEGNLLDDPTDLGINPAGFVIHSAIHMVRPEIDCVLHTHTAAGMAVSSQKQGLLMLNQHSMRFHNRVAYHDYEGVALDVDERDRLQKNLGDKYVLILRNHGLLTCGRTVREAFDFMYYLQRSCEAQIVAQSAGVELILGGDAVAEKVAMQFERPNRPSAQRDWPALTRMIDRVDPSYKD
ncbi:MAG: class II aldolase/adducin family protein [Alphaproteobacteria bacterium]|nr:class II aldolase/adducin family protein [Alphaproteobacteria bacterium]